MEFEIANLSAHMAFIPTIAEWQFNQWGHLIKDDSIDRRIETLHKHAKSSKIPQTYVAFSGETLLGSASLLEEDMHTRSELRPWLASVIVGAGFRRKGIGSALCQHVVTQAAMLNIATLYLFTPDQQQLYLQLGWTPIEDVEYRGEVVTLMQMRCEPG